MPAAKPNHNWLYDLGDYIAGRTILKREKAEVISDRNVYRIHYACCDREGTITQQSLRRIERSGYEGIKPCYVCCAIKASKAARAAPATVKEKAPSDLSLRYPGQKPLVIAWTRWAPPREEEIGKHFICR